MPPDGRLTDDMLAEQTEWALFLLPAGFAVQWLMLCAVNLYLAGRIVLASGAPRARLAGSGGHELSAGVRDPAVGLRCWRRMQAAPSASSAWALSGLFSAPTCLPAWRSPTSSAERLAPWLVWVVYLGLFFFWPFFMPLVVLAGLVEFDLRAEAALRLAPTLNLTSLSPRTEHLHASHPTRAHRPAWPDGRRRQRQERLCA